MVTLRLLKLQTINHAVEIAEKDLEDQTKTCDKFIRSGMLSKPDANEMLVKLKAKLFNTLVIKIKATRDWSET